MYCILSRYTTAPPQPQQHTTAGRGGLLQLYRNMRRAQPTFVDLKRAMKMWNVAIMFPLAVVPMLSSGCLFKSHNITNTYYNKQQIDTMYRM